MSESTQIPPVLTPTTPIAPPVPVVPERHPPRRPNILILVVAMVGLILTSFGIVSYLLTSNQSHEKTIETPSPTTTVAPSKFTTATITPSQAASLSAHLKVVSTEKTSPNGEYTISEKLQGENVVLTLNYKDQILVEDLVAKNEKAIGYGTKFGCPCATNFKGWLSSTSFLIRIVNSLDEEYEYLVDATTGLVDSQSFKKVK